MKRRKKLRKLTIELIRDMGNAVVVQVIDRVEVLPKHGRLYGLLKMFMAPARDAEACEP
jgi:hypothetical protein